MNKDLRKTTHPAVPTVFKQSLVEIVQLPEDNCALFTELQAAHCSDFQERAAKRQYFFIKIKIY